MSYTVNGLSKNQQEEFDALNYLFDHLGPDLVGIALIDWYQKLNLMIKGDVGYFYCPYIPLTKTNLKTL